MRIKPNQLKSHLQHSHFAPIYLLTGDEPLQMMECTDELRKTARTRGFGERLSLSIETGSEWDIFSEYTRTMSLFASKRLIEVHLASKTPNETGTRVLLDYLEHPTAETVVLFTADKLDTSKQKAKWFTTLEERGIVIQLWTVDLNRLPQWISERLSNCGLRATEAALQMIAERSEGDLLACAQEIEKLRLLYGEGQIDTPQVLEAVADNARFAVFDWVDTVLLGDMTRCVRQLRGLQAEGYEPILAAWALEREIRTLCQMSTMLQRGPSQETVFKEFRVWQQRREIVTTALKRHDVERWRQLLRQAVQIDRLIKGVEKGNPWDELLLLSVQVASGFALA